MKLTWRDKLTFLIGLIGIIIMGIYGIWNLTWIYILQDSDIVVNPSDYLFQQILFVIPLLICLIIMIINEKYFLPELEE